MSDVNLKLDELISGHDVDTKKLSAAFFAEDDIAVIVRCHFEVERAAIRVLDTITAGRWKKVRSQYLSEKLNLLEVLGAPPRLLAPARTLNNQRNDFAHEGLEAISEQQLLDVVRGVRAFVPQFHDNFDIEFHGKHEFSGKFKECSIPQKYAITSGILALLVGSIPELMKAYHSETQARAAARSAQPT